MFMNERIIEQDNRILLKSQGDKVSQLVMEKGLDKNENFNNVMRALEELQNHILSKQQMADNLVNSEVLNVMVELLKTLPTRDFEFSFLADYFMNLVQILSSYRKYHEVSNL